MIIVKCYRVMEGLCVEASCVHTDAAPPTGHLLYRRLLPMVGADPVDTVLALGEECSRMGQLALHDAIELTDECGL